MLKNVYTVARRWERQRTDRIGGNRNF